MPHPRRIADRSQDKLDPTGQQSSRYAEAGVDIEAGNRAVDLMKSAVRSTFTPAVRADIGSFGGLFALTKLPARPLLVASTDGVGTKVKLAGQHSRWQGIGQDIVNHCLNDILVQGARPLFFLDYIAADKLVPENVAAVVLGMAEACRAAGCALLGGETAEMPGVYTSGSCDVAGTVVGLVDQEALLPRPHDMQPGDLLFGLPSSGPHTNGYSLIRHVLAGRDLQQPLEDGIPLIDAVLAPHRSYLPHLLKLEEAGISIKGLAHITGGGLEDNLPRILPPGLLARINRGSWEVHQIFHRLLDWSGMETEEAYRVFNMGIGMVAVIAEDQAVPVKSALPDAIPIGTLTASSQSEPEVVFED
ncbi:MAG: phosphoribosylformylglycinamidine cyclo-ligase [Caldilineaceae bacterium SB0664_bin_27]|uniref:Phosphoribosylformylglycinamidine cyclo-ligase n=1 Tax=Caldilineaceae bacterium SB0664_bin_27 TaxID=2605260 RepID=A0A6B0YLG8_9CHLR|nr:phosphoribosylformylglycinamidine cyclo-ligase [Caldilineaceae bacterium SB0664_bin_27]